MILAKISKNIILKAVVVLSLFGATIVGLYAQNGVIIEEINDYYVVKSGNLLGLTLDESMKEFVIPPADFDRFEMDYRNDFIRAYVDKKAFYLYNIKGEKLVNEELIIEYKEQDYDYFRVKTKNGTGLLTSEMKVLVPPLYDKIKLEIETYNPNMLSCIVEKNGKVGMYFEDILVLPVEYDRFEHPTYADEFIAYKNGKAGILAAHYKNPKNLVTILPCIYDKIERFEEYNYSVTLGSNIGVFSTDNNAFIVPPTLGPIQWKKRTGLFDEQYFAFKTTIPKTGTKGHVLVCAVTAIEPIYVKSYVASEESMIIFQDPNGKWGVLELRHDSYLVVLLPEYDQIKTIWDDMEHFACQKNGKWGIIDYAKNQVVEFKYNKYDELPEQE